VASWKACRSRSSNDSRRGMPSQGEACWSSRRFNVELSELLETHGDLD
jgi:hypothetical protein